MSKPGVYEATINLTIQFYVDDPDNIQDPAMKAAIDYINSGDFEIFDLEYCVEDTEAFYYDSTH